MEQTNPILNQPTSPQIPVNPPVNPSSSNKYLWVGLLSVFLIVLSSTITYFLVKSQAPSQTSVVSPVPIIQATPTADPTGAWKVYRNIDLGIEFKYPNNWYVLDSSGKFPVALNQVEMKQFPPDSLAGPIYFSINESIKLDTGEKYPMQKTHKDHLLVLKDAFTSESIKINSNFILSARIATQLSGILKPSPAGENPYSKITTLPFGKYSFDISLYDQNYENIYDQILSTFKFTE